MPSFIDRSNERFGRLTVVQKREARRGKDVMWVCRCDCGNTVDVSAHDLSSGHTKSCGCIRSESSRNRGKANSTHGLTLTPTYRSWKALRYRTMNPKSKDYPRYGGRGIQVCERWNSFENFLEDMGHRPPGTSIDRINPDGHYEPENCRWASAHVQTHNRRSSKTTSANAR